MKQYFSDHKIKTVEDVVEMLKYYEQHQQQSSSRGYFKITYHFKQDLFCLGKIWL